MRTFSACCKSKVEEKRTPSGSYSRICLKCKDFCDVIFKITNSKKDKWK